MQLAVYSRNVANYKLRGNEGSREACMATWMVQTRLSNASAYTNVF